MYCFYFPEFPQTIHWTLFIYKCNINIKVNNSITIISYSHLIQSNNKGKTKNRLFIKLLKIYHFIQTFVTLILNLQNFLSRIVHLPLFWTFHYHFYRYQNENFQLVSQQYTVWSDCTKVQAGRFLYWWQRLITSVSAV